MIETKFKNTEIGKIPEEWIEKKLGDIGSLAMCKRIFQDETSNNGDVPFYKIGTFGQQADAYISKEKYEEYKRIYRFPNKGDILISAAGTIGRTVVYDGKPAYFQDSNIVWLAHNENCVANAFLYYVYQRIIWNTEDTTIARLYNNNFNNTIVCIPQSIVEQHRIASALTSVDNLISSLAKLIEKKKNIKQGAMQQLLTGKTRLKGFEGAWVEHTIDELFDLGNGYTPSKSNPAYWTNGTIPWFRMEDIRTNGRILTDSIKHVTPEAVKGNGLYPKYSIILSTTATIGEHALLIADSLANQRFTFLLRKVNRYDVIDIMYFYHYCFILGKWCRENINAGGLLAVNMDDLKNHSIHMPPTISEQRAIATILTKMDDEITALEAKKAKYEAVKQGMMQQLLTGKLRLIG